MDSNKFLYLLIGVFVVLLIFVLGVPLMKGSGYEKPHIKTAVQNAQFFEVIKLTGHLKISVSEFTAHSGHWPENLEELRLEKSIFTQSPYIDDIKLESGVISANLSSTFGRTAAVKIMPTNKPDSFRVNWECKTNIELRVKNNFCTHNGTVQYGLY